MMNISRVTIPVSMFNNTTEMHFSEHLIDMLRIDGKSLTKYLADRDCFLLTSINQVGLQIVVYGDTEQYFILNSRINCISLDYRIHDPEISLLKDEIEKNSNSNSSILKFFHQNRLIPETNSLIGNSQDLSRISIKEVESTLKEWIFKKNTTYFKEDDTDFNKPFSFECSSGSICGFYIPSFHISRINHIKTKIFETIMVRYGYLRRWRAMNSNYECGFDYLDLQTGTIFYSINGAGLEWMLTCIFEFGEENIIKNIAKKHNFLLDSKNISLIDNLHKQDTCSEEIYEYVKKFEVINIDSFY
ncbi:hypothetical protein [Vibrio parahaemolyticus]|uniref:hypothetical protein n=1 Tax=Vibrio parahaemolyticus TaxID=670 RepID=UPI00084A3091|nr:hypothetical protein [Vibrio parahaemolyticus]EGQ7856003.1 hypothetical protein [Vibrio parahaemolyticus]ODX85167.1 hypothetical protein BBM92_14285 [Vibrio parahaemolyticus]ODY08691.1 hypothetical protein BBM15_21090 [Vibrio parahaemolyticus]